MNIRQSEIWLVNFYPTVGEEIGKTRPAIVINDNRAGKLKLRIVAPITDWKDVYNNYPWMIKIEPNDKNSLSKTSAIDCFQIKSLSIERFIKKIGFVDNIFQIHNTIIKIFNLSYQIKE